MKIARIMALMLAMSGSLAIGAFTLPVHAQTPESVTVPPATMPAADPLMTPAAVPAVAPMVAPAANIAGNAPAPAPVIMPGAAAPLAGAPSSSPTTVAMPSAQPAMPTTLPTILPGTPPANLPTGTPPVVTQVMQNLQQAQSNVSVEDLSKAQDALTRLDLLLQIEKKIGEIKKTQDDRDSSSGGMMGQVPASALVLPGQMNSGNAVGAAAPSAVISSTPAVSTTANYEVEQISGTNGSYSAIVTTPDGDIKTVRMGDKLDGRTVQSISLDGVQLSAAGSKKGAKSSKTLMIHNDAVLLTPMAR